MIKNRVKIQKIDGFYRIINASGKIWKIKYECEEDALAIALKYNMLVFDSKHDFKIRQLKKIIGDIYENVEIDRDEEF